MPTAIDAHRAPCRTLGVTDYRTARGGCRGCGECCSRFLPMSRMDERRLVAYVERHGVVPRPEPEGSLDLTCPLLSNDRECMAYDARPDICRVYRCDEHARGILRPPAFAGHMRLVDVRELLEGGETMPVGSEAARALARDLWARGYSLRYIAGRLGVSDAAAARLVGAALLVRRGRRDGR